MAYSIDFIKKAVEYKQAGHTFKQLKEVFGISDQTYYIWINQYKNGFYEKMKVKQERQRKIDKEKLKTGSLSDYLCKWQNIKRTEPVLFQTQWRTGLTPAPNPLSALSIFYWRFELPKTVSSV